MATRVFLWIVLAALSLAAASGIFVIVSGNRLPWNVVGTLLSVGLFGLTSLGASAVYFRGVWTLAMRVAWVVSIGGLALYTAAIWAPSNRTQDWVFNVMWLTAIWAVALPHLGLLALTRFEGAWRGGRIGALVTVLGLAVSLSVHVFLHNNAHWQLTAVLGILAGLATIGLPIAQKLYGLSRQPPGLESTPAEVWLRCPRCEKEQTVSAGKAKCSGCGLRIELKVEEPRCVGCGYLLYKLASPQCPECGRGVPGVPV